MSPFNRNFQMRTFRLGATLLALLVACSSNPKPDADASAATARNADVITAAELADPAIVAGDVLQAVQRLRPRFLMSRGSVSGSSASAGQVQVSVDGGPLLRADHLRTLRPSAIAEIRYLNSSDAAQRFGTAAASGGVILVKSK